MEIKDRLKQIRSNLHITQQEFADRLGIKRNTVATYETGKSNPSDSAIVLICREFGIQEEWLRTGEGEMFQPKPMDILDQLAYEYNFSNADYVFVEKYVSLTPEKRKEIFGKVFDFFHEVEAALSDTDPYAPAYAGIKTPRSMDKIMEPLRTLQKENAASELSVEQAEAEYIKKISGAAQKEEFSASNIIEENRKKKNA